MSWKIFKEVDTYPSELLTNYKASTYVAYILPSMNLIMMYKILNGAVLVNEYFLFFLQYQLRY